MGNEGHFGFPSGARISTKIAPNNMNDDQQEEYFCTIKQQDVSSKYVIKTVANRRSSHD